MKWIYTHQVWQVLPALLLAVATDRFRCQSVKRIRILLVAHLKGEQGTLQAA